MKNSNRLHVPYSILNKCTTIKSLSKSRKSNNLLLIKQNIQIHILLPSLLILVIHRLKLLHHLPLLRELLLKIPRKHPHLPPTHRTLLLHQNPLHQTPRMKRMTAIQLYQHLPTHLRPPIHVQNLNLISRKSLYRHTSSQLFQTNRTHVSVRILKFKFFWRENCLTSEEDGPSS